MPLGLALQLGVVAASTFALWRLSLVLLPERDASGADSRTDAGTVPLTNPPAEDPASPEESPGGRS